MRSSEVKQLIVILLSSARRHEDPRQCLGLTSRQIIDRIEGILPPDEAPPSQKKLIEQVVEQLEDLESEFEIASRGEGRRIYRMAPPSLIMECISPLRAKYVGDRAFFREVIDLLQARSTPESFDIETTMELEVAREVLEARGIAVCSEETLFEFLPDPAMPTEMELSMAEQLEPDEFLGRIEVYVPKRGDFFDNRWIKLDEALPSGMSQLGRVREKSFRGRNASDMYLWMLEGKHYRMHNKQALLAMYRIDQDKNAARILSLDKDIPASIMKQLPVEYRKFLARYTVKSTANMQPEGTRDDRSASYLSVKYKYKSILSALLEGKLGINKPIN